MTQRGPLDAQGRGREWFSALWAVGVLVLAILPSLGSLGAGWISDDSGALGYVHRAGALADWDGPQYGMRVVRFWRPLITLTLGWQAELTGAAPEPLRAFNLACHAATALLAGGIARRLGASRLGAFAAGALVAGFRDQGGTVTWIVGRVDAQSVALTFAALWLALYQHAFGRALAGPCLFLACASKEIAFGAPLAALCFALGCAPASPAAGLGARALRGGVLSLTAGALLALGLRRLVLGTWVGGYPGVPWDAAAGAAGLAQILRYLAPVLIGGALALFLGGAGAGGWRSAALRSAALLAGLAPVLGLVAGGPLSAPNLRVLFGTDALAATAAAAVLGPRVRRPWLAAAPLLAVALVRLVAARADVCEWTASAALAKEHELRARAALEGVPPGTEPLFDASMPWLHGDAYCLALGVADRFRPPFEPAARPVWPRRVIFPERVPGERARPALHPRGTPAPLLLGEEARTVELFELAADGVPAGLVPIAVDAAVAAGGGARFTFPEVAGARLEFLVYTEIGYEVAALAHVPGQAEGLSLGEILRLGSGFSTLGEALIQAADCGARAALLEVRVVDAAGEPRAASALVPLAWEPDLLADLGVGG